MKPAHALALASTIGVLALGLTGCDRTVTGNPTTPSRVTVTETVPETVRPSSTTIQPTTTTPSRAAIPPDGAGAYSNVDPARFRLNPPTSVAIYAFSVPSGNIACFAGSEFICEIHDGPNQSPVESRCGIYGSEEQRVRIVGWFNYDKAPCSTILQGLWRAPGPVLNYGEQVHFSVPGAEFTCYSSSEALYCTGPQDYGFKLSRTEFVRYRLS